MSYAGSVFGLYFDASTSGAGVGSSSNATGADEWLGRAVLAFDVPTDLSPSTGPTTYLPGTIADWDGVNDNVLHILTGWPLSSEVTAFSCQANPGRVYEGTVYPFPIRLSKSLTTPGNVVITWAPSCSSVAEEYGIYEGTLGTWYSHVAITPFGGTLCVDTLSDLTEEVTPPFWSAYYLVVPHDVAEEGAYGVDRVNGRVPLMVERPPAPPGSRCASVQTVTACP